MKEESGYRLIAMNDGIGLFEVDFDPDERPIIRDAFPLFFQPIIDEDPTSSIDMLKCDVGDVLEAFEYPVLPDFVVAAPEVAEWKDILAGLVAQAKNTDEFRASLLEILSQMEHLSEDLRA
jgi:hypothetical protein